MRDDLTRSIQRFLSDPARRARSFAGLRVDDGARVERGVRELARDLGVDLDG